MKGLMEGTTLLELESEFAQVAARYLALHKELVELQRGLGWQVRTVREASGIGQREMAERIGMSAAYLSDMERGNRPVSPKYLAKIKRELEIG